jgi:glutamate synthase domain-containing protein 2
LIEALSFVSDVLIGFDLKKEIRVIASGKVFNGFHLVKHLALGADICNSARGMMIALGCVQSLECNTNRCPTGIATQDPKLARGLVVEDKAQRVARYHKATVNSALEIMAAAGLTQPHELHRSHINRRVSQTQVKRFDEIYPIPVAGSFLSETPPENYAQALQEASSDSFAPNHMVAQTHAGLTEL